MNENEPIIESALWSLSQIAESLKKGQNTLAKGVSLGEKGRLQKDTTISIPAIQRGKVWNAVRCEILWDSILRGIPIGAFSVTHNCNEFFLLDGQQRANAIALGYQDISSESETILWIDLGKESEKDVEQNDGNKKESDRKFFFMVTTKSQPWGYNISDNETRNKTLSAREKQDAVSKIGWNRDNYKGKTDRPAPYEMWPIKANCPIPFSILRKYLEDRSEETITFDSFMNYCRETPELKEFNWLKNLVRNYNENVDVVLRMWTKISEAIKRINTPCVLIQVVENLTDEDTSVFFRRMNKAGVVPSDEEIRYSMLKARIPALKENIDTIAENFMPPAVLADIAITSFYIRPFSNQEKQPWRSGASYPMVNELLRNDNENKAFSEYIQHDCCNIKHGLKESIECLKELLIDGNDYYLPKYVYSLLPKQNRDLYRLLIFIVQKWRNAIEQEGKPWWRQTLIALVTLVCWFKKKDNMISDGYYLYRECSNATKEDWERCTKQWLFESVQQNKLIPPTPLCIYENMEKYKAYDVFVQNLGNNAYLDGINRLWSWRSEHGRALLLFVCRSYLKDEFADYNPSDAVWFEENRPWDYDHIIPQSWLITGQGRKQGDCHYWVDRFLNSIGNISPIPFTKNREKNADHPGNYLAEKNTMIHVVPCKWGEFKSPKTTGHYIEQNKEDTVHFANCVASRFVVLYTKWYQELCIDNLFEIVNTDKNKDKRRLLFEQIKEELIKSKIEEIKIVFVFACSDGRQYECKCNADWARLWLSIIIRNSNNSPSPAVTANNTTIEYGLRRHPDQNSIDGRDYWWKDNRPDGQGSYSDIEFTAEELAKKMLEMVNREKSNN